MLSRRWSLARGRLALQIDAMSADSSLRHHRRRQVLLGTVWKEGLQRAAGLFHGFSVDHTVRLPILLLGIGYGGIL